jgi:sugar O-acyltransferase (sialic acid O-acetyltransferase NeuD family)
VPGTVVFGTGGMGREAAAWLADLGSAPLGFLDDDPGLHGHTVADLPVLGGAEWVEDDPTARVVVALGSPSARVEAAARLRALGAVVAGLTHPSVRLGPRSSVAEGSILCPDVLLSCDVEVGELAIINWGARIGHDGRIGPAAFVGPGVHLAGNVTVGARAEVGIGAVARPGVTIGEDSVVGAGAAVVTDVEPGSTVVGVPARELRRR